MLGYVRSRGVLDADAGALVLWTECGCGEWKADARELSEDLMLLGVPHYTTITGRCQPPWRSAATKKPAERWEKNLDHPRRPAAPAARAPVAQQDDRRHGDG